MSVFFGSNLHINLPLEPAVQFKLFHMQFNSFFFVILKLTVLFTHILSSPASIGWENDCWANG